MNECGGCGGKCCMDYAVALSVEDAKRIIAAGIEVDYSIDFTPVDDIECRCPDVLVDGRYAYMTLRRDDRGCCILSVLKGDNIKCGVHGLHPLVCRIYPFTEEKGKVAHRRKFRCERKWKPDEETENRIRNLLDLREKEIREYEAVARKWNLSGGGCRKDFLSYILEVK